MLVGEPKISLKKWSIFLAWQIERNSIWSDPDTRAQLKLEPPYLFDHELSFQIMNENNVNQLYIEWMNDYDVVKFTEQRFVQTSENDIKIFLSKMLESSSDLLYGICLDHYHIGNIKLSNINLHHKTADLSYLIGLKDYWGRGIATKAIAAMVDIGFRQLELAKINAGVYSNNIASSRVLEKNRFKLEGCKKAQYVFENQRIDAVLYGRLRDE